jgi:AP2-associated kinase
MICCSVDTSSSQLSKSFRNTGGFGVVDLVVDTHSKKEHVLKRCNIDREESFSVATKEINMLQRYRGPNVVALLDTTIVQKNRSSREALLLLEFCPGGHLLSRLLERGESYLPVDAIYRMFGQICVAISALHSSRPVVVHRDIKLENVLFGEVDLARHSLFSTTDSYRCYVLRCASTAAVGR